MSLRDSCISLAVAGSAKGFKVFQDVGLDVGVKVVERYQMVDREGLAIFGKGLFISFAAILTNFVVPSFGLSFLRLPIGATLMWFAPLVHGVIRPDSVLVSTRSRAVSPSAFLCPNLAGVQAKAFPTVGARKMDQVFWGCSVRCILALLGAMLPTSMFQTPWSGFKLFSTMAAMDKDPFSFRFMEKHFVAQGTTGPGAVFGSFGPILWDMKFNRAVIAMDDRHLFSRGRTWAK